MRDRRSDQRSHPVAEAIEEAERGIARVQRALDAHDGDLRALREAISGTLRLTRSLAATVDRIGLYAPSTVPDPAIVGDVVADLRALHGCLTTGAALVDPAVEDVRGLVEGMDRDGGPVPTVPTARTPRTVPAGPGADPGMDPADDFAARWEEWAALGPGPS
ncbi:hypothetical protein [Qaidamihabitans albus]|uniref:hypothetical protein n=1 Tax=Qaidamihabitans albus TaxID=2795733 RepID=UPI0018F1AAA0|nr:hypothetical protein [Qaidamihabitans albus]